MVRTVNCESGKSELLTVKRQLRTQLPPTSPSRGSAPAARREIMVGIMLAMLLEAPDQTIAAAGPPTIESSVVSAEYLSWIVTAYLLTATAVTPLYGKLADIRGRRPVISGAIGIFVAGSIISTSARSMLVLV